MVHSISISNSEKAMHSLQKYDSYNALSVVYFSDFESEDENDSVSSTVTREVFECKKLWKNATDSKKQKKAVRFTESIEVIPSVTLEITDNERRSTWYTRMELRLMKKHTRQYAKYVRTIDSNTISELLNDSLVDLYDETTTDDMVCLRGLEKHVTLPQTYRESYRSRRNILVKHVLCEQRRQKIEQKQRCHESNITFSDHYRINTSNNDQRCNVSVTYSQNCREKLGDGCKDIVADDEYIISSNCEKICDVSMTYSKYCRDYARDIALKSFYIPAFAV